MGRDGRLVVWLTQATQGFVCQSRMEKPMKHISEGVINSALLPVCVALQIKFKERWLLFSLHLKSCFYWVSSADIFSSRCEISPESAAAEERLIV